MDGKKGVVAEILIVVVIAASVILFIATFQNTEDTPNLARQTIDALIDLRDAIAQGILDWLASSVTEEPFACNGLYPMTSRLDEFLAALIPYIDNYLPDEPITDGDVTVNPGTAVDVEFTDEGITVILDGGTIVYDDDSILANDTLNQSLSFGIRLPLVMDRLENWTRCDHGNLSARLMDQLGTYCFFGKHHLGCGEDTPAMRIGVNDKDYLMRFAPSISMITESLTNVTAILNDYFAGKDSCGGDPLPEASGITCDFSVQDVDLTYLIAPWFPPDPCTGYCFSVWDFPKSYDHGPGYKYDLQNYRSDDTTHVWALPPVVDYQHTTDDELECASEPEREDVPSVVPYGPVVDLMTEPWAGPITDTFDQENRPHLFVNTTRGLAFKAVITCTDNSVSLLGQPVQYRFTFKYGVKQHCGSPQLEKQWQEPVCSPCGVPTDLDAGGCYTTDFKKTCGWYNTKCNESMDWVWLYGSGGHANPANTDWTIHNFFPNAFYPDGTPWLMAEGGQYEEYLDYRASKCNTPPNIGFEGPMAECAYAWNEICCGAPGYNKTCPQTTGIHLNPMWSGQADDYCYMDQGDYVTACLSPAYCAPPDQFDLGDVCVLPQCLKTPGAPGGYECRLPDDLNPDTIDADGLVGTFCGSDKTGNSNCYWCSDGSDLPGGRDDPLYGHCVFIMPGATVDPNGADGDICYPDSDYASGCTEPICEGTGSLSGTCNYYNNIQTDIPCDNPNAGQCMKGWCEGDPWCGSIPDPDAVGDPCYPDRTYTRECDAGGTPGTQSCHFPQACDVNGHCSDNPGGQPNCDACQVAPGGGGGCTPGVDPGCY